MDLQEVDVPLPRSKPTDIPLKRAMAHLEQLLVAAQKGHIAPEKYVPRA